MIVSWIGIALRNNIEEEKYLCCGKAEVLYNGIYCKHREAWQSAFGHMEKESTVAKYCEVSGLYLSSGSMRFKYLHRIPLSLINGV